jgi:hypothetical protein
MSSELRQEHGLKVLIPVEAQFKEWAYSWSFVGIVGLNPAGGHGYFSLVSVDRQIECMWVWGLSAPMHLGLK